MFALGAATLMFEVLLTRIVAVTLFSNLAFGVIALSLFGLAFGSAWAERSTFDSETERERAIEASLLGAAFSALLAAFLSTQLPLVPRSLGTAGAVAKTFLQRRHAFEHDPGQVRWSLVALVVLVQAVPFAMAGYAQAHAFARAAKRSSVLYAADLAGATLGSLATLLLLRVVGAAEGVSCVAVLFVLAASLGPPTTDGQRRWKRSGAAAIVLAAGVIFLTHPFDIRHAAGFSQDRIVGVDWSALARIGLYDRSNKVGTLEDPMLVVDNASATEVAFAHDDRFAHNLERIPYLLRPHGDVLVIGAGGGQEIETALATAPGRSRRVDAVELADGEERLMRRFFGSRNDFLLGQPGVRYQIGDGRSYLEMSSSRWDVIQMKEVNFHSFAGQAASAWTPSLLFTAEAMKSELAHLTPTGLLAMIRGMYFGGDRASTLEIVSTMRSATDSLGWELGPRLVIVDRERSAGFQRMSIVSAMPFTEGELASIHEIASQSGLVVRRTPRLPFDAIEEMVTGNHREAMARVLDKSGFLVEPTTDDHPFGYQPLPFLSAVFRIGPTASTPHAELQRTDFQVLLAGIVALFVLSTLLIAASTRRADRSTRSDAFRQLLTCSLLGAAFMLLEVILVERTSLLVGHPTVGFVAVVTSCLCGLGLGSALSGRLRLEHTTRRALVVAVWALVSVATMAIAPAWLASWFRVVHAAWRPWLAGMLILVGAVPLGTILPSVIRLSVVTGAASPAGCWSVNAACSVLGTVSAALLVRATGFAATSYLAWFMYLVALVLWVQQCRRASAAGPSITP